MKLTGFNFAHMSHLGHIMPPVDALSPMDLSASQTEGLIIPPAMVEAAPMVDKLQYAAYKVGAIAAANRREHPVSQPPAFTELTNQAEHNGTVMLENLPEVASPIVDFVREFGPDVVIAADRGGRMLGVAVHKVWQQRYPGIPFPTIDGKLHFGRISKSPTDEDIRMVVQHILNRSGVMAEMAMRRAEGDERPAKVLLLDDWVAGGGTVGRAQEHLEDCLGGAQNLDYAVGTMNGNRYHWAKHIIGSSDLGGYGWSDSGKYLGVEYNTSRGAKTSPWGWDRELAVWPKVVRSATARGLRSALDESVRSQVVSAPRTVSELATPIEQPLSQENQDNQTNQSPAALIGATR